MASGQWSKVGEASCLRGDLKPRLSEHQCLHLQGTRYWSAAVELLRTGNQARRSRAPLTGLVVARDFHSCRLSNTAFRAVQASGLSGCAPSLEVSVVAAARVKPLSACEPRQVDVIRRLERGL